VTWTYWRHDCDAWPAAEKTRKPEIGIRPYGPYLLERSDLAADAGTGAARTTQPQKAPLTTEIQAEDARLEPLNGRSKA
jgi:hypothetical protein